MKVSQLLILGILLFLLGCTPKAASPTPTTVPSTQPQATATRRITVLPTWTPSVAPTRGPTHTPRNTSTPLATPHGISSVVSGGIISQLLIDRPTGATLIKPANLVTMQYDPNAWMLNTFYPGDFMGYALNSRAIYDCKLEPITAPSGEGYQVENYNRQFGSAKFSVSRLSQAGGLFFTDYCTGEGEEATCYRLTPGTDHEACTESAETVISTYKLISNPFYEQAASSPNRWVCEDAAGTVGLCLISYSIPLNALGFTADGSAWAAGDDGLILHRVGQAWQEVSSPATHPIYDLSFSSLTSGWAVGDGAEVLEWDGNAWKETLPYHGPGEGPAGSTQVLYAVDAASVNEAWMAGATRGIDGKTFPLILHWEGKDLVEVSDLPECNCGMNAVLEIDRNNVYMAGGSDLGAIIFHWDGSVWTSTILAGADHLYALSQSPDGTVWAAGIEVARDQSDTRGALFRWDGTQWQRVATPPLTGGVYALNTLTSGQIVLGGDFTALLDGLEWQPITTDIAGYGWIVDLEKDQRGNLWALTRSGNLFKLAIK